MVWAFNLPGARYLGYTLRNSFPCPRRDSWMTPGIWALPGMFFMLEGEDSAQNWGIPRNPITDKLDLNYPYCPNLN